MSFDVITVGGGLAGASLARSLAVEGVQVLVLEKEKQFRDRVRGEGLLPWGVNEARDLGVYDLLLDSVALKVCLWTSHAWSKRPPRDLVTTTPRGAHCLNFYHPDMQEVMLAAAAEAGAEVRRGITVKSVESGCPAKVSVGDAHHSETLEARLVVGADGRNSKVRNWLGLEPIRDAERLMIAGVLLENTSIPESSIHVFRNSTRGEGVLCFPLAPGRVRTYFIYRKQNKRRGLAGRDQVSNFLKSCIHLGVPKDWIGRASPAGPLAEFSCADTWVKRPCREGVALIGDAASANDPAWGNGLSLALRDVRTLKDNLLSTDDWSQAVSCYARAHEEYFGAINRVTRWLTDLMYEVGPEADKRRDRVFPLMEKEKGRTPDYIALGPESPSDESARRRMFGED